MNNTNNNQSNDIEYLLNLRQPGKVLKPDEVEIGGFYLYKEKFGMVAVVKVIKGTRDGDWMDFQLAVKRVLYACWPVPKGTVFEVLYNLNLWGQPAAWHLEPSLTLIKSPAPLHLTAREKLQRESVL